MATTVPVQQNRTVSFTWSVVFRLALAVGAGALLAMSFALHPVWWAAWCAPVPLLCAATGEVRWVRLTALIAGTIAIAPLVSYYVEMTGPAVTVLILLLRIAGLLLPLRLTNLAARKLPLPFAMLVLPTTCAAIEQVIMTVSVNGAAGSIAYSQMDHPQLVQLAALGGVQAVVFLLLLPGSLLGLMLSRPWPAAQRRSAILAGALAIFGAASFSVIHLQGVSKTIPATLIATNRFDDIPRAWGPVWSVYEPAVRASARRGGIVLLPEKIALLDRAAAAQAAKQVATIARQTGAIVILGLEVRDSAYHNRALIVGPNETSAWYDKQRLVPGWEDRDTPGKRPFFARIAGTPIGVAICKDMHVPSIARAYSGRAALMAVPAWDFGRDGWMGARMTALRAIEDGFAIIRASRDGFVGAYDRNGRAIAEQKTAGGVTVLQAMVPLGGHSTFYGRFGDLFGWSCVGATLLLLALAVP